MLTEATRTNINRKRHWADNVQLFNGTPLFSWLELSVTDFCNRSCVFCPHADTDLYPNQPLHMSLPLVSKIAAELQSLNYAGAVVLCGYGEPLLHPALVDLVDILARQNGLRVEIVTNGDRLTPDYVSELLSVGTNYFIISAYDGPEQTALFDRVMIAAHCSPDQYTVRDRWQGPEDDYGLVLTNRAGTVQVGNQEQAKDGPCNYPSYQLTIDWNGDVLLCPQDWNKKLKFGNVNSQGLFEVWTSIRMHKRRRHLWKGRKGLTPCEECNACGTIHGTLHEEAWQTKLPLAAE